MGLVSSLLGAERDREARVHEETIERWRRNSDAPQADEGESVRLVTSQQLPLTPTIDLNEEVLGVAESWEVNSTPASSGDWSVDQSFIESQKDLFDEEKPRRWNPRAILNREATPSAPTPAPAPVVKEPVAMEAPVKIVTPPTPVARPQTPDPKLTVEEDLKRRFGNNIRSALGPGTVIEGKMSFDSPVRIDGTINGEVTSTSTLIVGEQALVKAELKVGSLIILGQVQGNVHASDLVEIRRGGQLDGDVTSQRIVIELGGYFEGVCKPLSSS